MLASLALHVLIGLSLAAFASRQQEEIPLEPEQVPQLTIVQAPEPTPPPLVPKNAPLTTVDPARKSVEKPKEKTFEANENSIAAAEKAATADNPLPGQDGADRPIMNLEDHDYSLGRPGATPQPKPTPAPKAQPTPTPNESPTPPEPTPQPTLAPDQLALLTETPTPVPSPPETEEKTEIPTPSETPTPTPEPSNTPPPPQSSYRDLQRKTVIRGGISNRGPAAINAVGTPLGKYVKQLQDAIGSRWYYLMEQDADLKSVGTTELRFDIEPDGHIENLRVLKNTTTEACASIAIRSIQETKFPPLSDDLVATLPGGHLTMDQMVFAIFPNR
ncbi:MAG TPA: energy transducer TonB [Chthoniobacterales bacterium]